jgi:CheY-like chemotaxis protein
MTKPLALLFYEKLLPGSQLLNRLQDLGYRVQSTSEVNAVPELARATRPLLVFMDLQDRQGRVPVIIQSLRQHVETGHLPVIAFAAEREAALQESARKAGASIVVNEGVLLQHLDQFMEQALNLE